MNRIPVKRRSRIDESLKKSRKTNLTQQVYILSGYFSFICGIIVLAIGSEGNRLDEDIGYVIAGAWALVGIVLILMSVLNSRDKKPDGFAIPINENGKKVDPKNTKKIKRIDNLIAQNRVKFTAMILILVGFYFSIVTLLIFSKAEFETFFYTFPILILVFLGISAVAIAPGLKTNINILKTLLPHFIMGLLPTFMIVIHDIIDEGWLIVGLIYGSLIMGFCFTLLFRHMSFRKNYIIYTKQEKYRNEEVTTRHGDED